MASQSVAQTSTITPLNLGTIQAMRHVGKRIGARVRWERDMSITVRFATGAPHRVYTPDGATALLAVMRAVEG